MNCDICCEREALEYDFELPRYKSLEGIIKKHYRLCKECATDLDNIISGMENFAYKDKIVYDEDKNKRFYF